MAYLASPQRRQVRQVRRQRHRAPLSLPQPRPLRMRICTRSHDAHYENNACRELERSPADV